MGTITAKQLHQETKTILDQLERGEPLIITRNGRPVGRLEPISRADAPKWDDVMHDVWEAQKTVTHRSQNPVLQERARRRR